MLVSLERAWKEGIKLVESPFCAHPVVDFANEGVTSVMLRQIEAELTKAARTVQSRS